MVAAWRRASEGVRIASAKSGEIPALSRKGNARKG
jgi:hypothetical protein